jgi:hypothetical protein
VVEDLPSLNLKSFVELSKEPCPMLSIILSACLIADPKQCRDFPIGLTDQYNCINLQVALMSVKVLPAEGGRPERPRLRKKDCTSRRF